MFLKGSLALAIPGAEDQLAIIFIIFSSPQFPLLFLIERFLNPGKGRSYSKEEPIEVTFGLPKLVFIKIRYLNTKT